MTTRGLIALTVSLGFHLVVLHFALKESPPPIPRPKVETTPVKWVWLTQEPPPSIARPTPAPSPPKRPKVVRAKVTAPPGPEREEAPLTATGEDTPRRAELEPSPAPVTPTAEEPGGVTLHPGDEPTDSELREGEQERVSARVSGWIASGLGAARVRGGLPDPRYGQLGSDLRVATDEVPSFLDTNNPKAVMGALLESWGAGAARYVKTGAPFAEPEGRLESVEKPSEVAKGTGNGSPDMQAVAQLFAAGARLQEFADGRAGLELYALVELKQHPSGAFDSATLIRPSGLAPFDAWVSERARTVGLAFSFDAGARSKPLRSVWRFDGIIIYRRKLKPDTFDGRAMLGAVTMAALSALSAIGHQTPPGPGAPARPLGPRMPGLTGRFDELSGEADLVDLTNPSYDCRVTLLEAD